MINYIISHKGNNRGTSSTSSSDNCTVQNALWTLVKNYNATSEYFFKNNSLSSVEGTSNSIYTNALLYGQGDLIGTFTIYILKDITGQGDYQTLILVEESELLEPTDVNLTFKKTNMRHYRIKWSKNKS